MAPESARPLLPGLHTLALLLPLVLGCGDDTTADDATGGSLAAGGSTSTASGGGGAGSANGGGGAGGASAGGAGPGAPCGEPEVPGTWLDARTGLCWQNPSGSDTDDYGWSEAIDHCDQLALGEGPWHLPTIDELRTLIDGCPGTEPGGACEVSDDCNGGGCLSADCSSCEDLAGPGTGGCYAPPELEGPCSLFWTSLPDDQNDGFSWAINLRDGDVTSVIDGSLMYGRCVRPGP